MNDYYYHVPWLWIWGYWSQYLLLAGTPRDLSALKRPNPSFCRMVARMQCPECALHKPLVWREPLYLQKNSDKFFESALIVSAWRASQGRWLQDDSLCRCLKSPGCPEARKKETYLAGIVIPRDVCVHKLKLPTLLTSVILGRRLKTHSSTKLHQLER